MKKEGKLKKVQRENKFSEQAEIIDKLKPFYFRLNNDLRSLKKTKELSKEDEEELKEIIGKKSVFSYQLRAMEGLLVDFSSESISLLRKLLLGKKNTNITESIIDESTSFLDDIICPNNEQQEAITDITQYYQKGTAYIFEGNPGTGKTEMAIEIARRFYAEGKRVLIITRLHEKVNDLLLLFKRYSRLENYENILRYCTPDTEKDVKVKISEELKEFLPKQIITKFYNNIVNNIVISKDYPKLLQDTLKEWKEYITKESYNENQEQNPLTNLLLLTYQIIFSTDIAVGRENSILSYWLNNNVDLVILDESTSSTLSSFLVGARFGNAWLLLIDQDDDESLLDFDLIKEILLSCWRNYSRKIENKIGLYLNYGPRLESLSEEFSRKWIINKNVSSLNYFKREAFSLVKNELEIRIKSPVAYLKADESSTLTTRIFELKQNYRMRDKYENLFKKKFTCFDEKKHEQTCIGTTKSPIDLKIVKISEIGAFWDTARLDSPEEKNENNSYFNTNEADVIIQFLNNFDLSINQDNETKPFHIMVASNYSAQVNILRELWKKQGRPNPCLEISFATIGSAKGKDVDLVIWSLTREVRSKQKISIGLAGSLNCIYSILTRPKWGLVIIGNYHTYNRIKIKVEQQKHKSPKNQRIHNFISRFKIEIERRGSYERIIKRDIA